MHRESQLFTSINQKKYQLSWALFCFQFEARAVAMYDVGAITDVDFILEGNCSTSTRNRWTERWEQDSAADVCENRN